MGDIANMIITGYLDEMGEYCESYTEPGKVQKKKKKWNYNRPYRKSNKPESCRTKADATNGIVKWLNYAKLNVNKTGTTTPDGGHWQHLLIRRYNEEVMKLPLKNLNPMSQEIQKQFGEFIKWVKENYK